MAASPPPPILSLELPSDTGRVLSLQSHTVQVVFLYVNDIVIQNGHKFLHIFFREFVQVFAPYKTQNNWVILQSDGV